MLGLLASILPFAAGASVTPTILLLQLRYCGAAQGSRATGAVFAAGCAAVLVVVTGLALALAAGTGGADSSSTDVGIVKLGLALVLAGYGLWSLRRPAARVPLLPAGPVGRMVQARLKRVHEIVGAHERMLLPALTFAFAAYLAVPGLVKLA